MHIATTGDHFVFSLPLAVSNAEDLRMVANYDNVFVLSCACCVLCVKFVNQENQFKPTGSLNMFQKGSPSGSLQTEMITQ